MDKYKIKFLLLFLLILVLVCFAYFFFKFKKPSVPIDETYVLGKQNELYSFNDSSQSKVEVIKELKDVSLDTKINTKTRLLAGTVVVGSFFDFGMQLEKGFSPNSFTEREIYEYSKQINSLGNSKTDLLTAYIGLTFYPQEMTAESVSSLLRSYQEYAKNLSSTDTDCSGESKFASVLYLSQKNNLTPVIDEFGNYFDAFERADNLCRTNRKKNVFRQFMWLAALSDIGKSSREEEKAQEIVQFLIDKENLVSKATLSQYLKNSYFASKKEPDTVIIVDRLIAKYPAFKSFVESLQ